MRLVDHGIASRWIRSPPSNLLVPDSKSDCYLLQTSEPAWGKLHESTTQRFTLMVVPIAYGCNHSRLANLLANLLAFWLASIETKHVSSCFKQSWDLSEINKSIWRRQASQIMFSWVSHVFSTSTCVTCIQYSFIHYIISLLYLSLYPFNYDIPWLKHHISTLMMDKP